MKSCSMLLPDTVAGGKTDSILVRHGPSTHALTSPFAEAEKEGFYEIAAMYRNISIAEKGHEERYLAFVNNIENATVFAKEGEVVWQCRNCGFIFTGKEAPEVCPACLHPQAYFEVKKENYQDSAFLQGKDIDIWKGCIVGWMQPFYDWCFLFFQYYGK